ncbi:MAG: hypothetical protein WDO18_23065 [Acidobacteriota bacterium]
MSRTTLHDLVDRIPDSELPAAERYLEFLSYNVAYRAARTAPADDEPVTRDDASAMLRATKEIETGQVVDHDEILKEFGVR